MKTRALTALIDPVLSVFGTLIIIAGLVPDIDGKTVGLIVLGVLFIQAGMFRVSRKLFAEERQFLALRAEGDFFISLMRQLNAAGLALKEEETEERHREFKDIQKAMQDSLERMTEHAGKTVEYIAQEAGQPDAVSMWKSEFGGEPAVDSNKRVDEATK